MEHETGIRGRTLDKFEELTSTLACLRAFLQGCVAEVDGKPRAKELNTTRSDGKPLRDGGWAWHGISVPFVIDGERFHLGIYKYVETPPGRDMDQGHLFLEAYRDADQSAPAAFVQFDPESLAPEELDRVRAAFVDAWKKRPIPADLSPP